MSSTLRVVGLSKDSNDLDTTESATDIHTPRGSSKGVHRRQTIGTDGTGSFCAPNLRFIGDGRRAWESRTRMYLSTTTPITGGCLLGGVTRHWRETRDGWEAHAVAMFMSG